jgi:hypothetical protein
MKTTNNAKVTNLVELTKVLSVKERDQEHFFLMENIE